VYSKMSFRCENCGTENISNTDYCVWCKNRLSPQEYNAGSNSSDLKNGNMALATQRKVNLNEDRKRNRVSEAHPKAIAIKESVPVVRTKRKPTSYFIKTPVLIMIVAFTLWFVADAMGALTGVDFLGKAEAGLWRLFYRAKSRFNYLNIPNIQKPLDPCKITGITYFQGESYIAVGDNIYSPNNSVCGGKIINISHDEVTIEFPNHKGVYGFPTLLDF